MSCGQPLWKPVESGENPGKRIGLRCSTMRSVQVLPEPIRLTTEAMASYVLGTAPVELSREW